MLQKFTNLLELLHDFSVSKPVHYAPGKMIYGFTYTYALHIKGI